MKKLRNIPIVKRICLFAAVIAFCCITLLFLQIIKCTNYAVKQTTENQLLDTVESRTTIINDYISEIEDCIRGFAVSDEVVNILKEPDNKEYQEKIQNYIKKYADVKGTFEGLYVADTDTVVVAHTIVKDIGVQYRSGDDRTAFLSQILVENHMTNRGIMVSPSTGELIISMYYPVFENGKPLGYVGGAVYADEFMNSVTETDIKGLPEIEYVFINAASKVYLYNENEELLNTETNDEAYLEIIDKVAGTSDSVSDSLIYKDSDGVQSLVVYKYIPERNWIFIVKDSTKELYSSLKALRCSIGLLCYLATSLIIFAVWLFLRPVSKELGKVEKSLIRLSNIDLNAVDEVTELVGRNDECGKIATAVSQLCTVLKESTGDINRILSEMSEGNLAVDVNMHSEYYTGDFTFLADVLRKINSNLSNVMQEISVASEQVRTGAEQVAVSAQSLSHGTIEQTASIEGLADNIRNIEHKVNENSSECKNAHKYMEQTFAHVNEASDKMQYLTNAMENINSSFEKITGIIKTIEDIAFQTNILALNAAVEAARAGEAGKGFAVVADEVRNLAAKAASAVQDTAVLIESSNVAVDEGMGITAQTSDAITSLNEYTSSLKEIIDIIAASSDEQRVMVNTINNEINQISGVVQNTSATAEESAAASEELTGQAISLNSLISRFKIK